MKVTVGISAYNNQVELADSIRSVFAQTYPNWELIIIDDGSTDRSPDIAQAVAAPHVTVIRENTNRGLAARRNQLARLATGDFITYLDADDMMHPQRLERQVAYFAAHPATDVLGTGIYSIDVEYTPVGNRIFTPRDLTPHNALKRSMMSNTTVMARTAWFHTNTYDETFKRSQDHELWCRTYNAYNFANLAAPLAFVREAYRPPQTYLKLYLHNCRFNRQIIRKYGPGMVGWPYTRYLLLQNYIKEWSYRLLTPAGLQTWLMRRRLPTLSQDDVTKARRVIDVLLKTPVPGLEEPFLSARN